MDSSRVWRLKIEAEPRLRAPRAAPAPSVSYYDAQIWACAHLNQIPVIFSEDFSDGRVIEGVRFANPFSETFELEKWI